MMIGCEGTWHIGDSGGFYWVNEINTEETITRLWDIFGAINAALKKHSKTTNNSSVKTDDITKRILTCHEPNILIFKKLLSKKLVKLI